MLPFAYFSLFLLLLPFVRTANVLPSHFCSLTQQGTCIRNEPLNVTGNITSPSDLPIQIISTYLICSGRCVISIQSNSSVTINDSILLGSFINISSPNLTLLDSEVSTNGTIGDNAGSFDNSNSSSMLQGNAFLGIGAFCGSAFDALDQSYGLACELPSDLLPIQSYYGSGSKTNESFLNGGGLINLTATSFVSLNSTISSSGFPLSIVKNTTTTCQSILGGTGGTIALIATTARISSDTYFRAEGGSFCGGNGNGFGGAGGKVVFKINAFNTDAQGTWLLKTDFINSLSGLDNVIVTGGRNMLDDDANNGFCHVGAVGAFCLNYPGDQVLVLNGWGQKTHNGMMLNSSELGAIDRVSMVNGAVASIKVSGCGTGSSCSLSINSLEVIGAIFSDYMLLPNLINSMTYNITNYMSISSNSRVDLNVVSYFIGSKITISDSFLDFRGTLCLYLDFILLRGNSSLVSSDELSLLMIYSGLSIELARQSVLSTGYIAVLSSKSMVLEGEIWARNPYCADEDTSLRQSRFFDFAQSNQSNLSIDILASYRRYYLNTSKPFQLPDFVNFFKLGLFQTNFTLILISEQNISLTASFLMKSSAISISCSYLTISPNATVSTVGFGCDQFEGPGKGTKIFNAQYECAGNGGSYGGYQGFGLAATADQSDLCKQFAMDFVLKYGDPFYPKYQGSGGGGKDGTAGGGVIYINSPSGILNDGWVQSDGASLSRDSCVNVSGSGAGSGGSIQIYTSVLSGNGVISANGGSSFDYCGEGGGGRILIFFYGWEKPDSAETISLWKGSITAKAGTRTMDLPELMDMGLNSSYFGTEGTLFTSPCAPGYYAPYSALCTKCPSNTFKEIPGYQSCSPCLNKPLYSDYSNMTGIDSINCPYTCQVTFGSRISSTCDDFFAAYYDALNGMFMPIALVFTLAVIILGRIMKNYIRKKPSIKEYDYSELHKVLESPEKIEALKQEKKLQVPDLFFHVHRVNIYGTNRYDNRWFLKSEPPEEIVYLVSIKQYRAFVNKFNKLLAWHWITTFLMRLLAFMYYPFYAVILHLLRRRKYKKLCKFIEKNENYFWSKNNTSNNEIASIKMKLSTSREYTLAFLDILCYKNPSTKYFNMTHPLTLMLAGEGSFFRPFYLDTYCPLFYTLYISLLRKLNDELDFKGVHKQEYIDRIRKFVLKINKISCRIEFSASADKFFAPIWELSNLIQCWNTNYFSIFGYKLELIIMQIPKEKYSNYENTITLLENKEFENFHKFIQEVHTIKTEYSLYDVRFGLFCLNLETEDKNFFPQHRRISFMIEEDEYFPKWSTNNGIPEENDIIQLKECYKKKHESHFFIQNSNLLILDKNVDIFDYIKKRNRRNPWKLARRLFYRMRYFFISHKRSSRLKKFMIYIIFANLIVFDMFFYFLYLLNIFYFGIFPDFVSVFLVYPFAMIVSPVVGLFWTASCSYTLGKAFLVFNFMAGVSLLLNIALIIAYWEGGLNLLILLAKIIHIIFKILLSWYGSIFLTHVRKKMN